MLKTVCPSYPSVSAHPGQIIPREDSRALIEEFVTRPAANGCRVLVGDLRMARKYGLGSARYAWLVRHGAVGAPGDDPRGLHVRTSCSRFDCVRHLKAGKFSPLIAKWCLTK